MKEQTNPLVSTLSINDSLKLIAIIVIASFVVNHQVLITRLLHAAIARVRTTPDVSLENSRNALSNSMTRSVEKEVVEPRTRQVMIYRYFSETRDLENSTCDDATDIGSGLVMLAETNKYCPVAFYPPTR